MIIITLRAVFLSLCLLAIAGCAAKFHSAIPQDYSGEVATIADTYERLGTTNANFYYLKEVNGKPVWNAMEESYRTSYGQANLTTAGAVRNVPARQLKLLLVAQISNPGFFVSADTPTDKYRFEREVHFTPEPKKTYLVKGMLTGSHSAIWLEDLDRQVISDVVQVDIDGNQVAELIDRSAVDEKPVAQSPAQLFANIAGGENAAMIKAKFGEPDEVHDKKALPFLRAPDMAIYDYHGLGKVVFISRDDLYVDHVKPELESRDDLAAIKAQIMDSEGMILQKVATQLLRRGETDRTILDIMADKIWMHRDSDEKYTADGVALLCRTLGTSGDSRYKIFLETVALEAKTAKLRRHARKSAELIPEGSAEPYEPKTATLRRDV